MKNKLWGVWELEEKIGTGSFGTVYKARKTELGKHFFAAIKHISFPKNEEELEEIKREGNVISIDSIRDYYKDTIDDLVKEIEIMYELRANKNIVDYQDHLIVEKENKLGYDVYIRMELLTPLDKYMENKKIDEQIVTKIGVDICQALEVCKTHHLLHRDIKPANIFVDENGTFKLGDFGVAKKLEKTTLNMSKKGTFNYMAPEIYKGEPADIRSDIYSLGIVMYRLLNNNKAPFIDKDITVVKASLNEEALIKRMSGQLIPPIEGVSEKLQNIIYTACSYDKNKRYDDPDTMRKDLLKSDDKYERKFSDEYDKTVSIYEDYDKTVSIYEDYDKTVSIYDKEEKVKEDIKEDLFMPNNSDDELRERIRKIIEEERNNDKPKYDVEVYYEKVNKKMPLLSFLLSFSLALLLFVPISYITNSKSLKYTILYIIQNEQLFVSEIIILVTFCFITLLAFLMSITSKKQYKNSKKLYIVNMILLGVQAILFYTKRFNINILYFGYLIITFTLYIIPYKWSLKLEKLKVEKEDIDYYKEKNKKLKIIYEKEEKKNTKIYIFIGLIFLVSVIFAVLPLENQSNKNLGNNYIKIITDYINLRDEPSYSGNIIDLVYQDEVYNILSSIESHNIVWYEIQMENGKRGYLTSGYNHDYIDTIIQNNKVKRLEVIADYINVRETANTTSNNLGKVYKGEQYNVLEVINGDNYYWYKILYNGEEAYIASPKGNEYVKLMGDYND